MRLDGEAVLLCRSCTSGWTDWVHGALWLLPTGLLRIRLGLAETRLHVFSQRTVDGTLPAVDPVVFPVGQILAEHPTNRFLPFDGMERARLRRGLLSHSLTADLADGSRARLLWLAMEPATNELRLRLPPLLGDRFIGPWQLRGDRFGPRRPFRIR